MKITNKPLDQVVMSKRHLEQKILGLLRDWQSEFGLAITCINVKRSTYYIVSDPDVSVWIEDVKTEVSLP